MLIHGESDLGDWVVSPQTEKLVFLFLGDEVLLLTY